MEKIDPKHRAYITSLVIDKLATRLAELSTVAADPMAQLYGETLHRAVLVFSEQVSWGRYSNLDGAALARSHLKIRLDRFFQSLLILEEPNPFVALGFGQGLSADAVKTAAEYFKAEAADLITPAAPRAQSPASEDISLRPAPSPPASDPLPSSPSSTPTADAPPAGPQSQSADRS